MRGHIAVQKINLFLVLVSMCLFQVANIERNSYHHLIARIINLFFCDST